VAWKGHDFYRGSSHETAKPATSSVAKAATTCAADHELRDGSNVIARGRRSEVMKAARVSHGATIGRVGAEPTFQWIESQEAWVFLGV